MDAREFMGMYIAGLNKIEEERIYLRYLHQWQYLKDETIRNYDEYFARVTGKGIDQRSDEEILADTEEAMRKLRGNSEETQRKLRGNSEEIKRKHNGYINF